MIVIVSNWIHVYVYLCNLIYDLSIVLWCYKCYSFLSGTFEHQYIFLILYFIIIIIILSLYIGFVLVVLIIWYKKSKQTIYVELFWWVRNYGYYDYYLVKCMPIIIPFVIPFSYKI